MDPSLGREIASWDPAKEAFSSWLKGFNLLTMGSRLSDQGKIALMVRKFPRGRQLQLKLVVERYSKPTFLEVVEALRRELEGADVGDWKARLGQLVDSQRPDEPARALWTRVIDAASQMACDPTEDGLLQVFLTKLRPAFSEAVADRNLSASSSVASVLDACASVEQLRRWVAVEETTVRSAQLDPRTEQRAVLAFRRGDVKCEKCGRRNHSVKECKACWSCGRVGHRAKDCPGPKAVRQSKPVMRDREGRKRSAPAALGPRPKGPGKEDRRGKFKVRKVNVAAPVESVEEAFPDDGGLCFMLQTDQRRQLGICMATCEFACRTIPCLFDTGGALNLIGHPATPSGFLR